MVVEFSSSNDASSSSSSRSERRPRHSWSELQRANTARYPRQLVLSQELCLEATEKNPEPTELPPPLGCTMGAMGARILVCVLGPGKRYLAERLCWYLKFFHGMRCEVFDANEVSRAEVLAYIDDPDETAATQLMRSNPAEDDVDRLKMNVDVGKIAVVVGDGVAWGGTTREDRERMRVAAHVKLLFVEYVGDKSVETINEEEEVRYVKIHNYGETVIVRRVRDYQLLLVVKYLAHAHPRKRVVYLTRHGQSEYNKLKKIGGNPGLTDLGTAYARWLGESFVRREGIDSTPSRLWTSSMRRTIETARYLPHPLLELSSGRSWHQMQHRVYRNLDELFAGDYEGMTYDQIMAENPDEGGLRKFDKLGYRYPRGESYLDLIARIDPLITELESYEEPLLVVSHQATLRVVYAYLTRTLRADAPKIDLPLHTVIKLEWDEGAASTPAETRYRFSAAEDDGQQHF
ncbi:hypothetical protein CTAYLR_000650 [Chrysophaeum taylorii]|uniref:6-phosphofructo-2-kinase domain-containing protein n=1 Tax=Chrysophaeum taylorii TaxID=2483200 RepID=A0AAD7U9D4_9STRA|nr:hypothetical protein CTAYLR_000650 [Chrysophaeum taylorii]